MKGREMLKNWLGETGSCYTGEFISILTHNANYFGPRGGFWHNPVGRWLDSATAGTVFDGASTLEPYIAGAVAMGLLGLGSYLALKNVKYAKIADELERGEKTVDQVLKEYEEDERALMKIAKYTGDENAQKIMEGYKKMRESKLDKIKDHREKLKYIKNQYEKRVRWWEVLVPFYNFYGTVKAYRAIKDFHREIAELVKNEKISRKALEEMFGERKAKKIMEKYGRKGTDKGDKFSGNSDSGNSE